MNEEEDLVELSVIKGWAGEPITDTIVYPSSEYFVFKGWNREIPSTFPDEDIKFIPIIGNNSSITFKAYPGKFPNDEKSDQVYIGEIGTPFSKTPPTPIRTGYTFNSWNSELPSIYPEHNIEIQSLWDPNSYDIIFNYNGGNIDEEMSSVSSISYDSPYPIAPSPTKTFNVDFVSADSETEIAQTSSFNCPFTGYWTSRDSTGTQYYNNNNSPLMSSYSIEDDLTLYAGWNNPAAPSTGNFSYTPEQKGYDFSGWYEDRNWTTRIYNYSSLSENKTLFAKWTPKTYTIYFDYNYGKTGNVSASTSSVTYDSIAPNAPNVTTPPQYKISFVSAATGSTVAQTKYFNRPFTGFFSDHSDGYGTGTRYYNADRSKTNAISPYTIASSITCYAGWGNAGSSGNLTALYAPTRSGYKFDGWCDDTNRTHVITGFSEINEHKTVYAKWTLTATSYDVTFDTNYDYDSGSITASSKDWSTNTSISVGTASLTEVPEDFKLQYIDMTLYSYTRNNQRTLIKATFSNVSVQVNNVTHDTTIEQSKRISGFNGTYNKDNDLTISIHCEINKGSKPHIGIVKARIDKLHYVNN